MIKARRFVPCVVSLVLFAAVASAAETPAPGPSAWADEAARWLQKEMPTLLPQTFVPGATVALIEGRAVVWQGAFGTKNAATGEPMTLDTVFEAASLSKPVFAYGVMKLVGRGLLDLDKPLIGYIDDPSLFEAYPPTRDGDPRYRKITARHVLTHSTGFPNWFQGRMVIRFEPGERFSYSGEAYSLLAAVVGKITGKTFNDLMAETVFTPLGMGDSSYVWLDTYDKRFSAAHDSLGGRVDRRKMSRATPGASLYTTSADYAKFLAALLNGEGLTETAWKAMLSPQIDVPAGNGSPEKAFDWGLGVGVQETEKGPGFWHWGDNGEFQSYFEVLTAEKRGLIVFLNGVNGQAVSRAVIQAVLGLSRPAIATAYFDYPSIDSPEFRMLKAYLSGGYEGFVRTAAPIPDPGLENAVNRLGYSLLRARKREGAIEVFRYNVARFPKSANTYDSLAEAYLAAGDKAKAIEFYEKALAIDPQFPSAVEALKRLKGGRP